MWHATLALVFACLAVPVHAQCPWKDDGDLATGLSDSQWLITGDRHWLINGGSMQIQPTPYQRSLTIGALLREVQLDGDSYDLRLIAPISDEDLIQNMGRNTVCFPMPALPTGECGDLGLSDISISGPAELAGQQAQAILVLRPDTPDHFVGVLRVLKSFGARDVLIGQIEMTRR